ncbi:MAG: carboxypeptidase-like regulatory domain-containing protein, partial [Bacteroidia bacterium]
MICHVGFSQNKISGTIKDSKTQQAIPFASIGIAGTQLGTLSDGNGVFELPLRSFADTVSISSIGYNNLSLTGNELKNNSDKIFYLKPEAYYLKEVEINAKNRVYKTLGTSNYSKNICTAFVGENANWRGEQAAILAHNK